LRLQAIGCALALLGAPGVSASAGDEGAPAGKAASRRHAGPSAEFDRIARSAAAAREAGKLAEAAEAFGKALRLRPEWIEGHWSLATTLYDLDRFGEAREHFRRVVAARPKDGVARALLALCDVRLKDYDAALAGLQESRALGIPNADVRSVAAFQFALLLNRGGAPEAAFEILRGLAVQGRDSPAVIEAFGLSTLRLRAMPEEVPPGKRDMVVLAGRGGYHMARGRRTAVGRLALEELVSRFPEEPGVHYAFGAYVAPEEPEKALLEFRKELARDPAHYPALLQIASLEAKRGHADLALPPAEEAARLAPNVPAARLILGRALLELGETERAVSELEKGAALAPESADIQFALARAYQRAGRAGDAEKARQEFLRLDRAAREKEAAPASGEVREPEAPPERSREGAS
jgi:tetratricopeptide (TPR) repeat protein